MEAIQAAYASNLRQSNQAKGKVRGGSTISQQTAKNLFTFADRSFVRKGLETYFTFMAEHLWDKQRIMQAYLNAAEWGDGVFGIQAAAQARFKVSAGELTPYQAALLAAVLPSPNKWSATNPGPYVRRRAATIAARMNAVRAQGLDSCVLGGYEAPRRRAPAQPLPPMEALPPDVAAEADAPVMEPAAEMIPTELDDAKPIVTPGFEDGSAGAGGGSAAGRTGFRARGSRPAAVSIPSPACVRPPAQRACLQKVRPRRTPLIRPLRGHLLPPREREGHDVFQSAISTCACTSLSSVCTGPPS